MKTRKKLHRALTGAFALAVAVTSGTPAVPVNAKEKQATAPGEISVDPSTHYQTLKGWGTSLCWWGNSIGSWGDQDFNGDGRPDREEIAELAFSPEYLNLNIVRYNVGGGDKPDSSIKRCEGLVPGWTKDMTGTEDGAGEFNETAFYAKETEEMSDAGQLWMLEQANEYRKDSGDIINEVFSNSPPYYMTKSGSSTGGTDNDLNNLKDDQYGAFATYLARAAKWVDNNLKEKYGTGVTYIEPLNEPDTNYWKDGSTKQEGCIFNTGELQSKAYQEMQKALDTEGLKDIQITGTDETSLWNAMNSFNRLDDGVKKNMTTIGAHTYGGNDNERKELRRISQSYDKDLWMSEVTRGGGAHDEGSHESMDAANTRSQSEGIMADLKYMQPSAWVAWLVADSEYECLQTNSNWGLLHAVFEKDGPVKDYHTNLVDGSGNKHDWVPAQGYWSTTKQFYTMMQYSKYLKAGYIMIDIGDGNMCAAVAPDGKELVLVAQNFEDGERKTTVDLSRFDNISKAETYRTSDSESCTLVDTADVSDKVLDVTLPSKSVATYVIKADGGKKVCSVDDYADIVDADVVKTDSDWTSDVDKFTYTGDWNESAEKFGGGKYTEGDGSVSFTFEGTQAAVHGTKAPEGAKVKVSVDGGEAKEVSLKADSKNGKALIYYTGELADGKHTIDITKADGEEGKLIEINYAKVITGEYAEEPAGVKESGIVYTVSGVQPVLPKKVEVVTNKGNVTEKDVKWTLGNEDFTEDTELKGTVQGTKEQASVKVMVVPENMQYFIDCNSTSSPIYASVDSYASLFNEVADQKYTDSWGYVDEYGTHGEKPDDEYDTGWYAAEGQSIQYKLPLEAGKYNVSFGFKEWWPDGNTSRPMKITMTQGTEVTELGATNTWDESNNPWNEDTFEVNCSTKGEVTFSVDKAENADPVLSFIKVQNVLDLTALKEELAKAAAIDTGKKSDKAKAVEAEKLEALDKAVRKAHPLLYKADSTQEKADSATAEVKEAVEAIGDVGGEELTKEKLAANDYVLYTANCGTPDPSVLPNKDQERWGLLQAKVADQEFGPDSVTGSKWGCDPPNEFSKVAKNGDDATDIGNSFVYMTEDVEFDKYKSGIGYSFEVPEEDIEGIEKDTYEVTVAFKHKWDSRLLNVLLEGQTVATDIEVNYDSWVSRTFKVKVTDGELNVMVKAPRRTDAKGDPILNYIKVRAVEETEPNIPNYTSITGTAGETMYDTNGNQIQAHGGQIQKLTVDGEERYWWIGEDKTYDYRPCGGIHMYSSSDLYNWRDEGVVLRTMESMDQFENDEYFKALYGGDSQEQKEAVFVDIDKNNCVMERPKMLYNDKTGKYVIWFHADGRYPGSDADYGKAKGGVAIGDSPTGPFKMLGSYKLNYHNDPEADHGYDEWEGRGSLRDMNLFKDDDGTGYIIYSSEGNKTTFIAKLNDEYTDLAVPREEAIEGTGLGEEELRNSHFTRNFIGWSREAPAMFKYKEKYYIVNSGCTGWSPNPAEYAVADHPLGPWTAMGDPCPDWGNGTTYDTQSTCVFPVDAENGEFIYMGDRWNAGDLSESRYVWLPVEFQPGNKIALRRHDNWTLDILKGKGLFEIETELPKSVESASEIAGLLPDTVEITYGTDKEVTPVTWDIGELSEDKIGTVEITGNLTEKDRSFTHEIHIVSPKTQYFFDSGATGKSEYFDLAKEKLGEALKNANADQAYDQENKAGYLGKVQEGDDDEDFDIGLHNGKSLLETGWWAASGKSIDYAFEMEPGEYVLSAGFQEWWNEERGMKLTVTQDGQEPASQEFVLGQVSKNQQVNQPFKVENAGKVTVSVSKVSGGDPVLSWIAVMKTADLEENVDKTALASKIAEVEAVTGTGYTAASFAAYQEAVKTAYDKAVAVNGDESAEQALVDQTVSELDQAFTEAKKLLVTLSQRIEQALKENTVPEESKDTYTEDTWNAYVQAKEALAAMQDAPEVTETQIEEAIGQLVAAKEALEVKPGVEVNKTALKNAITEAEKLEGDADKYTEESWKTFTDCLEAARIAMAEETTTQQDADSKATALNNAREGLVEKVIAADKTLLLEKIADAKSEASKTDQYTEESIAGLNAAIAIAQGIADKEDATQEEVDAQITALDAAIGLLEEIKDDPNPDDTDDPDDPNKPEDPDDPNKPEDPDDPNKPEDPDDPNKPEDPDDPNKPEDPDDPNKPEDPDDPNKPEDPDDPNKPEDPDDPTPGQTLVDDATGIKAEGDVTDGSKLIVTEISGTDYPQLTDSVKGKKILGVYEVKIINGSFTGKLKLTFPVDAKYNGKKVTIIHQKQSGETEKFTPTVKNGTVSVEVTELSPFLLAADVNDGGKVDPPDNNGNGANNQNKSPVKKPTVKTGDEGNIMVPIFFGTAALIAVGVVLFKRTRNKIS